MHDISTTCPLCKTTSRYGAELIGRYTLCPACRGRFYIEVPPLGEGKAATWPQLAISPAMVPSGSTTLDDLLWDTQRGDRFVIESLLRIERVLRWHSLGIVVLAALVLAVLTVLWMR